MKNVKNDDDAHEQKSASGFFPRVFLRLIEEMKSGKLVGDKSVLDALFQHVNYLSEENAKIIAQRILENFNPQDPNSMSGHSTALELLAQLSCRGGEIARLQIINTLRGIEWRCVATIPLSTSS